nr:ABC transporter permease [uncultured Albidiferax sp.]
MDDIQLSSILVAMVRSAPVLIFAALGGLFAERSGIVDISLEGKILGSAFASACVAYATQSPWFGVLAGIAVSCLLALLHGYVCIRQRGNQLVSGMAINIAVSGLTFVLAQFFFQQGGRSPSLDEGRFGVLNIPGTQGLADVPLLGWLLRQLIGGHTVLVYLAFLAVPLVHWVVNHTRFGLRLRAVGDNPHAADTAGINVGRTRFLALLVGGVLCGLSGAYLAIVQTGFFLSDMSAGNGFLALAALVFGSWRAVHTTLGCLMFAFFSALQIQLEGVVLPVIGKVPGSLIQMIPYIVTVIILAGFMAKSVAPKAIGVPFIKSR